MIQNFIRYKNTFYNEKLFKKKKKKKNPYL